MVATLSDRLPPHDMAAERAVLGALIRDPDVLPDVAAVLREEAFYFYANRRVFVALAGIAAAGAPIDLVTLHDALRQGGHLADVGGAPYLAELWEAVPTGVNATYHAKLVRDAATVRALIHAANEILRDAYDRTQPADELVALAERKLYALAMDAHGDATSARHVRDVAREALRDIDARIANGTGLSGLATGYADLDQTLGGMRPGELLVIGARPSLGKTALSLNIAERVARAGAPVLFVSLEMPARDIAERLLAMESGVSMHRLSRPRDLSRDDIDALVEAGSDRGIAGAPIYLDDAPDQTAARIASEARRAARRYGVRLVVVDYLQLMRPENPRDNRTQQVGASALRMKQMARGLGVPVILLSQLNRELEHQNRKPKLADLRESGDIEAHADRVILLHRENDLSANDVVWPIDLIVAKNRNGPTGDVRLAYRRPVLRFENSAVATRGW
jgi:replicative DNA helicase